MKKPTFKDYPTDAGLHNAMLYYARHHDRPDMECFVTYEDGSSHVLHTFEPATRPVSYKTRDGELYTVEVDTAKFEPDFLVKYNELEEPKTLAELKKMVRAWLSENSKNFKVGWRVVQ